MWIEIPNIRHRCVCAAILIVLVSATAADANYLIKLKNGKEYVTARYWQQGRQLLFDVYGGVFGVERTFVAGIEKSPQVRVHHLDDQNLTMIPKSKAREVKNSAEAAATSESKLEMQPSANDPVVGEFNRLRDRSKQVSGLLTSEILELLKEITAFKNKLSKDSKLFIDYGREFNDAHELGDIVESALRARTQ